jgi:glycosyltransferase involved in cell wall biosynthesis
MQAHEAAPGATPPRFSVVIPAFNESTYLPECLRSLAAQDFTGAVELIVVDNNSTDGTASVARAMGATVVTEPKPGVCSARQRGTEVACGEIIVSTDADTTFERGWLSAIDRAFARNPGCAAVAGSCRFVDGPWWAMVYPKLLFGLVHALFRMTGRVCYVTATNTAFRRTAWSGYDTRLTQGGDELDLLRRLRARGRVIFDPHHPTLTSARRLNRGLLYNLAVTLFFYYLLGYALNRLFRRRLVGTAPVFRSTADSRSSWWGPGQLASACAVLVFLGGVTVGLVQLV